MFQKLETLFIAERGAHFVFHTAVYFKPEHPHAGKLAEQLVKEVSKTGVKEPSSFAAHAVG